MFIEIHIAGKPFKRFLYPDLAIEAEKTWLENVQWRDKMIDELVEHFKATVSPYFNHDPSYELYIVFESKINNDDNSIFPD